jgi:hypothetical protein
VTGHLVHIGYPKTGSNFLRRWFAAHPDLSYIEGGIGGYSSVLDIAREGVSPHPDAAYRVTSAEGLATPHANIGADLVDYERIRRKPMPAGQAAVCATLAALFPNAHILIVTRGYRSMILSAYSQYVRTGGEDGFEQFAGLTSEGGATRQDAWGYDYLVGLYRDAFPGRVITLPYELLRDNPACFIGEIEARLGLARRDFVPARQNPSLSPVELAWYPRLTRRIRSLPLGARLRRAIERRYLRMAMTNRLGGSIALLQRLRPAEPVTGDQLTDQLVGAWRGRSEPFRGDPLYAPYAADYLL